jgi:hypothetical protein
MRAQGEERVGHRRRRVARRARRRRAKKNIKIRRRKRCVQVENHAHLVCEADDARALSRGMQGLAIRVAKSVNRVLARKGKVFGERYHARSLESPSEVRNAVVYVLNNVRKHETGRLVPRSYPKRWLDSRWLDRGCTSARHFHGWHGIAHRHPDDTSEVVFPRTWLLEKGFLKHGRVRTNEVPGGHEPVPQATVAMNAG